MPTRSLLDQRFNASQFNTDNSSDKWNSTMGKNNKKNKAKKKAAAVSKNVEQTKSTDAADEIKAVETTETTEENGTVDAALSVETEAAKENGAIASTPSVETEVATVAGEEGKKKGDEEPQVSRNVVTRDYFGGYLVFWAFSIFRYEPFILYSTCLLHRCWRLKRTLH